MMRMRIDYGFLVGLLLLSFTGCGGGGGGDTAQTVPLPAQEKTVALRLFSRGDLSGGNLSGVAVTIKLPSGLSVKKDAAGNVEQGVVVASGMTEGKGVVTPPVYTPAGDAAPAQISFVVASSVPAGFGTGEFVKVTLLREGDPPPAQAFLVTDFKPVDLNFVPVVLVPELVVTQD